MFLNEMQVLQQGFDEESEQDKIDYVSTVD